MTRLTTSGVVRMPSRRPSEFDSPFGWWSDLVESVTGNRSLKFLLTTLIASISVVIGLLVIGGVAGEEWFARFWRVAGVGAIVAILCVVGLVGAIRHRSADADDDITDDLEAIITRVYEDGQTQSASSTKPQVDYIIWDKSPRRSGTAACGEGRIVDTDTGLRGSFHVRWSDGSPGLPDTVRVPAQPNGFWDITFEF